MSKVKQPTFDEHGHLVITEADKLGFIRKVEAIRLPAEIMAQVVIRAAKGGWSMQKYRFELEKAKFLFMTEQMIEECDYWIELENDLARFEGDGGRAA